MGLKFSTVSSSSPEEVREYYDSGGGVDWGVDYTRDEAGFSTNPAVLRLNLVLRLVEEFNCDNILDAGCADAPVAEELLKRGKTVRGVDFSGTQIERGKQRLQATGFDPDLIAVGDVTDLGSFEDARFDSVLCLGVLPHIESMDVAVAELVRVCRPGGILMLSFRNDLFDLFTFNSFTVQFYEEHVLPKVPCSQDQKARARSGIRRLISNPDVPQLDYSPSQDGFGGLTRINSNPLTIGDDLKPFGLSHLKTGFYKFHPFPPLLSAEFPDYAVLGAKMDEKLCFSWEGLLLASTFVSVFRKL
jgi:ubiquinone/menaquinone biosynthesis C-methylase UbiE